LSETRRPFKLLFKAFPKFDIKPSNSTLIVLDAQKLTMDPDGAYARLVRLKGIEAEFSYYFESLNETIPNIKKILEKCREIETGIIFTRIVPYTNEADGEISHGLDGITPYKSDADIIDSLTPIDGETVLDKMCENPFNSNELESILNEMKTKFLLICGVRTPGPLNSVVLDAADRGYGVIVISDACTGGVPNGARFLSGGLIKVRSTRAVLEMLSEINTGDSSR